MQIEQEIKPQEIKQTEVLIATCDGKMPAVLVSPRPHPTYRKPAILLLMEAFGLTSHIRDVAVRLAKAGYVVLTPDLYYRNLPDNKFGYDEVEQAMTMMGQLNFGEPMEHDLKAALAYIKTHPDVDPAQVGVTGFCLGGGLTFFTACQFSSEIAAAAPFYGMVLDEWIDAVKHITVPMHLFFGGQDPFIPGERIQQIQARLRELDKDHTLTIYPNASHGFFCNERVDYNPLAATDAWNKLLDFFQQHLAER